MNGADGGQVRRRRLPPQLLANLRCAPGRVLPLQPDNRRFQLRRQSVRLTIGASTAIAERRDAAILVALENLVARLPRDPELGAQRRHLLALEQAGDKPESLVHDVTLLPRHRPSNALRGKVSRMCTEYRVTYVSGRTTIRFRVLCALCGLCVPGPRMRREGVPERRVTVRPAAHDGRTLHPQEE